MPGSAQQGRVEFWIGGWFCEGGLSQWVSSRGAACRPVLSTLRAHCAKRFPQGVFAEATASSSTGVVVLVILFGGKANVAALSPSADLHWIGWSFFGPLSLHIPGEIRGEGGWCHLRATGFEQESRTRIYTNEGAPSLFESSGLAGPWS